MSPHSLLVRMVTSFALLLLATSFVVGQAAAPGKADPKKATVLAGLVIVMLLMWGRMLGGSKSGPASASATCPKSRPSTGTSRSRWPRR